MGRGFAFTDGATPGMNRSSGARISTGCMNRCLLFMRGIMKEGGGQTRSNQRDCENHFPSLNPIEISPQNATISTNESFAVG